MVDLARSLSDPGPCDDCLRLSPRPGTWRGCRAHRCPACDALSDRAGSAVGCADHAPRPTEAAEGCPRCAQLAALFGPGATCRVHPPAAAAAPALAVEPAASKATDVPPPVPAAASPAPPPVSTCGAALTDHQLARLATAVAPLAAVNTAAGARSSFRDPREPASHGAPQAETTLERLCDSGLMRLARDAWGTLQQLGAAERATVLWVAERAGAAVDAGEWAFALGRAMGPADWRHREARLAERRERLAQTLTVVVRHARRRLTAAGAQELDAARSESAQAAAEHELVCAELRAWAEPRLRRAYEAWMKNQHDAG